MILTIVYIVLFLAYLVVIIVISKRLNKREDEIERRIDELMKGGK